MVTPTCVKLAHKTSQYTFLVDFHFVVLGIPSPSLSLPSSPLPRPVLAGFVCQLDTAGVITEKGASVEEMPP